MENGIKDKVYEWAKAGGEFRAGLMLFLTWNRNVYYTRNIEIKGAVRGMKTLVTEFANKTKIPTAELYKLISGTTSEDPEYINQKGNDPKAQERLNIETENLKKEEAHKTTMRLREEFPFLGDKDCPEEFAILVNKMITAYDDYRRDREKLFDVNNNDHEQCYQAAKLVLDAYILNRNIWQELNYYKVHGKILGNLPEFKLRRLRDEYNALSTARLVQIATNNIRRNMSYNKKKLSDNKTKNKEEIRERMAEEEDKLNIINKILLNRGEAYS